MLSCVNPSLFPPCMRPFGRTHGPHVMGVVPCGIMPHDTMPFVRFTSKYVKFRHSRNPAQFDLVARFRQMNQTVKFVSSSEI